MPAFAESAAEPPLADSYYALLRRGDGRNRGEGGLRGCHPAGGGGEWGFFQVVNHGVRPELLEAMRREQARLFRLPFEAKATAGLFNDSYRWGTPTATSPRQLSWSEAFQGPLAGMFGSRCNFGEPITISDM